MVVYRMYVSSVSVFISILFIFHFLLLFLLLKMKDYFKVIPDGYMLDHINFANLLTMFRLSSLPTICFLFLLSRHYHINSILLIFTTLAFLTDLFDGYLARKTKQITQMGKMLDSSSDYSVVFVISVVLFTFDLISQWFFLLITFRLVFHAVGMALLFFKHEEIKFETTYLGKAAIFSAMTLYALKILSLLDFHISWYAIFLKYTEYLAGSIVFVSIFDKIIFFKKKLSPQG